MENLQKWMVRLAIARLNENHCLLSKISPIFCVGPQARVLKTNDFSETQFDPTVGLAVVLLIRK